MAYSLNDPYRLYRYVLRANALLCGLGLGLLFLDVATRPVIRGRFSLVVIGCNALLAGVVLTTYFIGELAPSTPVGGAVMLVLFLGQLVCVVLPVTYLGENLKP